MKIAIISDVHGNLAALNATLKDIENKKVNMIYFLGDVLGKGPHIKECLDILKEKCNIMIRGNCDRYFSMNHDFISNYSESERERIVWNHSKITNEDREYLLNLPYYKDIYMSGSLIRFFHATPYADDVAITNLDSLDKKYEMFKSSEMIKEEKEADVVVYGHLHHAFMDKLYNKTLINVGSVGNSYDPVRNPKKDSNVLNTTAAHYLIIEGNYGSKKYDSDLSFHFIRVPYDIKKELESKNLYVQPEVFEFELINGIYQNMEKINKYFTDLGIDISKI